MLSKPDQSLNSLASNLGNRFLQGQLKVTSSVLKKYKSTGRLNTTTFEYQRMSKPIADEIDRVLAKYFGLTEEELDFIINFDIKYRMGKKQLHKERIDGLPSWHNY